MVYRLARAVASIRCVYGIKLALRLLDNGADPACSAAPINTMTLGLDKSPVNLFDVVLLIAAITGILQGRKHGMSGELLRLLKWIAIIAGCTFAYEPVGRSLGQVTDMFDPLAGYITAYIIVGVLIFLLFTGLKRNMGDKVVGSDIFGHGEYYLGMGSGLVRAFCVLLAALAILNARSFSKKEIQDEEKYQHDLYGSDFFPTLHSVQSSVFEKSFTGPYIKQYLGFLLIQPTKPSHTEHHQREASF
jgi:uncharacterized membrane protein required for colicin V production